jgi:hypothetical protein
MTARVYSNGVQLKEAELMTLMCPACNGLLRDPVQVTACGDRFCQSCIDRLMRKNKAPYKCPVDGTEFNANEVRKDRGCLKELQGLEIECTTKPTSCGWRGHLPNLEAHLAECPTVEVQCSLGCGKHVIKTQLSTHVSSQCPNRPTQCHHCKTSVPIQNLESHYQSCEEVPVDCDYCSKHLSSRKQLESHLESECTEYQIRCPMSSTTLCDFQAKRPEMSDHMQKHTIQFAELLMTAMRKIDSLEEKVTSLTEGCREDKRKIEILTSRLERVEKEKEDGKEKIVTLEKQIKGIKITALDSGFELSRGQFVETDCAVTKTPHSTALESSRLPLHTSQTRNMSRSFKALSTQVSTGRGTDAAAVSIMRQEMESHQTQLFKISENLQTVQQSLTQHAVVIDEVRLRQDVLDVKTTNGVFIWKIPDIRRRYRDALDGRTISLYSPPFYTSPHGYCMCVRTYLNGDGIGKGTHMSVFFVLMRSEHDSLLCYPFKQSVRFTLINQGNPSASITEAFIPDLTSPSFQRPEKDMNVASGFPKFARQSVLHDDNFTKGNTIFIKCQVDLSGLSSQ